MAGKIERFEDLICWQEARVLVRMVYEATSKDSFRRDFAARDQMRRAALSAMSNIAEGFGRFSPREFIRFLEFSFTSANEVKSLCYASLDSILMSESDSQRLMSKAEHVKALDPGLIAYLKRRKP